MTESHTADFGQSFGAPSQPAVPIGSRPIGQVNGEGSGAWIPSLASVLEKQEEKQGAIQPPPGAVFTPSTGASTAQLAAWRASNGYGARSAHGSALPAFELPPSRSRNNGVVALVLILLLVVVGGAGAGYWYFLRDKSDRGTTQAADASTAGRTLTFPASIAGRHRVALPATAQKDLRSQASIARDGQHFQLVVFAQKGSSKPDVIVMVIRPNENAQIWQQVTTMGSTSAVQFFASNAFNKSRVDHGLPGVSIENKDPGPLGGGMSCASLPSSEGADGCVWGDRSFVALTFVRRTTSVTSVDDAADVARTVRESAEH